MEDFVLPKGARVRLLDLSREEYNGRIVEVRGFDQEAGRYITQLDPETQLRVRPRNVSLRL